LEIKNKHAGDLLGKQMEGKTNTSLLKMGDRDPSTAKLEGQLKLEYNNKLHVCTDPYKKAVSTWVSIGLSHQHYKILVSIRYTSSCWPVILTIRTWN